MASSSSSNNSDNMDAIFCILLWLPVASLLRFKVVCKSWYSFIESSDFISQHCRLHSGNQNLILLGGPSTLTKQHNTYIYLLSADKSVPLDLPFIEDPYKFMSVKLIASCNGLVCLQQDRTVCLWNPATKQFRNLPHLPVIPIKGLYHIGFGFDVETNDYKVVSVSWFHDKADVHVYSLSSDSWRIVDTDDFPDAVIYFDLKTPYRNGIYCWLGWIYPTEEESLSIIISFDFSNEVFEIIPLPDSIRNYGNNSLTLAILRENIVCINRVGDHSSRTSRGWYDDKWMENEYEVDIWMLNEYDVKEPWTKLYTIGAISVNWHWLMGFSKKGDFLLFVEDGKLFLYDLITQEVRNLPLQVSLGFEVIAYEDSLVSIRRKNGAANRTMCADQNGLLMLNNHSMARSSGGWCYVDIPADVVFRILLRLPVVSLLRFKSVCKSWCSLIKSSDFVAQHLLHQHHHKHNNTFLILSPNPYQGLLFEDSSHPSPNVSCACLLSAHKFELLDLPYRKGWEFRSLKIAASCDGIICLQHEEDCNVYLWNPSTRQFRALLEESWDVNPRGTDFSLGFGFDFKTNDYKLVRFHNDLNSDIQVYSLSTDSWRIIDNVAVPTVDYIDSGPKAPYQNGIYCWLGIIDQITCSKTIVSFDFSNELFGTIPLPDHIKYSTHLELSILREHIACIDTASYSSEMETCYLDIWLLNEYGVEESWTKLYTIGPFSRDWDWLTVFSNNGDFYLLVKNGQLCLCNLVTQETKILTVQVKIQGDDEQLIIGKEIVVYEESLVSIKRGKSVVNRDVCEVQHSLP